MQQNGESIWRTFAGLRANDQLAAALQNRSGLVSRASNLLIEIDGVPDDNAIMGMVSTSGELPVSEAAIDAASKDIKFVDYRPPDLRWKMLTARLSDLMRSRMPFPSCHTGRPEVVNLANRRAMP